jgi:hypothetical protein
MNVKSRINIFLSGIILIFSMSFFIYYSNVSLIFKPYGFELKKNNDLAFNPVKKKKKKIASKQIIVVKKNLIDTSAKRFLLIGDSEVEGLSNPFYDYCKKNGHELALAMIWYSSTDMTYANSDTLKKIIDQYKPNHIIIAIGLNQIYQTSFEGSEQAIEKIIETMFELFDIGATFLHVQPVLALFASGQTSGCVVDSGEYSTSIYPITEGYQLDSCSLKLPYGGAQITEILARLMLEKGYGAHFNEPSSAYHTITDKKLQTVRRIKEQIAYVSTEPKYHSDLVSLGNERKNSLSNTMTLTSPVISPRNGEKYS